MYNSLAVILMAKRLQVTNENVYESYKLVEFRNMNKRLKYVLMNTVIKEFKKI